MWQLTASGKAGHFLISRFSTHTLPQTGRPNSPPVITFRRAQKAYDERIREIKHASFTLLSNVLYWRSWPQSYNRLASLLSTKWDQPYSSIMGWIQCKLSILPPTICHHVYQRVPVTPRAQQETPINMVMSETKAQKEEMLVTCCIGGGG